MNKSGYCSKKVRSVGKPIDISDLFTTIAEVSPNTPTMPVGFHTSLEYAEMHQVSERTMQRRIKTLWSKGKVQVKMGYDKNILGKSFKVPFYKVDKASLLK